MDLLAFIKEQNLIDFTYGSEPFSLADFKKDVKTAQNGASIEFAHRDGLLIRLDINLFDENSIYWRVKLKNTGAQNTQNIKNFRSCAIALPFGEGGSVHTTRGTWGGPFEEDFTMEKGPLVAKQPLCYSSNGGRSSEKTMPYFDINNGDKGVLCAIGWTGQWDASILYEDNTVTYKAGIQDTDFFLYPGEEVNLATSLLLFYEQGQIKAHNAFRRLIKKEFSPMGKGQRPKHVPVSMNHWGFTTSETLCKYAKMYKEEDIGIDILWVDAGWFGTPDLSDMGSWIGHPGNWEEDKRTHPDRFATVAKAAKENGMGFLLWYEIERACSIHKVSQEHPDWFLKLKNDENEPLRTYLLNLGTEGGYNFMLNILRRDIKDLEMAWYRQDFNIHPLPYWRENDEPNRAGITEIKYINGLYRLLGQLMEEFPSLMIDNCASGGSRLDIEMMRYSVPLWRSDCQCSAKADADACQAQMMGGAGWMPYTAAGVAGDPSDTYRIRSGYSNGMALSYDGDFHTSTWYPYSFEEYKDKVVQLKKLVHEFKSIRKYFDGDYYPLMPQSLDKTHFCAWQFDLPEEGGGIIQVFRREKSPYPEIVLALQAIQPGTRYAIKDLDSGLVTEISAQELLEKGFAVRIEKQRDSRVYEYKILK